MNHNNKLDIVIFVQSRHNMYVVIVKLQHTVHMNIKKMIG